MRTCLANERRRQVLGLLIELGDLERHFERPSKDHAVGEALRALRHATAAGLVARRVSLLCAGAPAHGDHLSYLRTVETDGDT